ncbi:MAG: MerR family transcriptional regulator [Legionellales bacterium]|nr:MerR family transcriptional regulator [Legionellales bacterium]
MIPQKLEQNSLHEVIPPKRYFTIGEVSEVCDVKPHVLRYWEEEFSQLKPTKRRGNRRYYKYKDILLIKKIYELLYEKGYTINGARQWLTQSTKKSQDGAVDQKQSERAPSKAISKGVLREAIRDLEDILVILEN